MVHPHSTRSLMKGMGGALLTVGVLILAVGGWSMVELSTSVDKVLAVDEAAVAVAEARAAVVLDSGPQTVAGIPESAWSGLAANISATDLPEIYQADAATIVAQLRQAVAGDRSRRQATSAALVDLQAAVYRRRAEVVAEQEARARAVAVVLSLTVAVGLAIIAATAAWVRGSLLSRFRDMSSTSRRIVDGADERLDTSIHDPLGGVAAAFNAGLDKQAELVTALGAENRRATLSRQIADGLDLALDNDAIHEVLRRAMHVMVPADAAAELIITDGDGADEIRSTVATHGPQCPVTDRRECAAMRRGGTQRFADPEAISACTHLSGRDIGRATCIPTTFLGHPLGVLHVVEGSGSDQPLDEALLVELASTAANRIGTMRAFALEESHARVDPLTGLLNRRAFERQAALVTRGVLAMADLDHFKLINDGYGHQVGDQALALFSSVLTRATRVGTDILCRWGGEEFAILLPDTDMCTATEVIGRVQELLSRDSVTQPPAFTSSWGLADMRGSLGTAVADADKALYRAKAEGRNRYVVATMDTASAFDVLPTGPVELQVGLI